MHGFSAFVYMLENAYVYAWMYAYLHTFNQHMLCVLEKIRDY
jgi:hypothetical protein